MVQTIRMQPRLRSGVLVTILAGLMSLSGAGASLAANSPAQRGEQLAPGTVAASVVTLCGLAVMLVVQPHGGKATLYAGEAMETKLSELGIEDDPSGGYELADFYDPIGPACQRILAEHERLLRTQFKD